MRRLEYLLAVCCFLATSDALSHPGNVHLRELEPIYPPHFSESSSIADEDDTSGEEETFADVQTGSGEHEEPDSGEEEDFAVVHSEESASDVDEEFAVVGDVDSGASEVHIPVTVQQEDIPASKEALPEPAAGAGEPPEPALPEVDCRVCPRLYAFAGLNAIIEGLRTSLVQEFLSGSIGMDLIPLVYYPETLTIVGEPIPYFAPYTKLFRTLGFEIPLHYYAILHGFTADKKRQTYLRIERDRVAVRVTVVHRPWPGIMPGSVIERIIMGMPKPVPETVIPSFPSTLYPILRELALETYSISQRNCQQFLSSMVAALVREGWTYSHMTIACQNPHAILRDFRRALEWCFPSCMHDVDTLVVAPSVALYGAATALGRLFGL